MDKELNALIVLFVSCYFTQADQQFNIYANTTKVLNKLHANYDSRLRPYHQGRALNISVYMTVVSFSAIREIDMEFTLDLFFKQAWNDPRLKHDYASTILLPGSEKKNFWIPDTFFLNVKTAKFHHVPASNNRLLIKENGDIELSERLTVSASCRMDLRDYPLDTQTCKLEILSYSYDVNDIDYHWKPGEDMLVLDAEMSEFELFDYFSKRKTVEYVIGTYTHLEAYFVFRRRLAYSFIQIYSPTFLIVILSWLSFWISKDAVPARVALGITTVLTIVTLMGSLRNSVPKVSYIKAVDSYLIVSFIFVFGVLLEYIAVLMHSQHKKRKSNDQKKNPIDENVAGFDVESASSIILSPSNRSSRRLSGRLSQIDMNNVSGPLGSLRPASHRQLATKGITKDPGNAAMPELENDIGYPPLGYTKSSIQRHSYQKRFSKDSKDVSIAEMDEGVDSSFPLTGYSPAVNRKQDQYGQAGWTSEPVGISEVEITEDGYCPMNYPAHRRSKRASKDSRDMPFIGKEADPVGAIASRGSPHAQQGIYRHSKGFSASDVFINNSKPNNLKSILRRSSSQQQNVPGPAIQHSPYTASRPTSRLWKYIPRRWFAKSSGDDVDICDKIARVMFPLTFFLFNLSYYLRYSR